MPLPLVVVVTGNVLTFVQFAAPLVLFHKPAAREPQNRICPLLGSTANR